jgi:hypothetical protein
MVSINFISLLLQRFTTFTSVILSLFVGVSILSKSFLSCLFLGQAYYWAGGLALGLGCGRAVAGVRLGTSGSG